MKYQVNIFYSLQVEADSKEQAEEKAGEYIASEEGQGVRLSDMSIEVEEIGAAVHDPRTCENSVPCSDCEEAERTCGNCGRQAVRKLGALVRCERCARL
jgi:hypothetical protein